MTEESLQNNFFDTEYLKADLKGRSVRGGAVTMAAQGARFFLQMGSTMVLARLLTPQDFGLIAMVTAVTGFVAMFKDMGLSMATVQRAEINHAQISTLFWINVVLSLCVMLVVAALAPAIAWFYGEPRLTWVTLALAGAFIFGGLTVQHQALLRRQMRFGTLALIQIISMLVGIAAGIVAAVYGAGYWSLVLMGLANGLANILGVWLTCRWRPGLPVRRSGIRKMLAFGGNLTGFNFLNYGASQIDRVLLGRFMGAGPVGFYHKAYNLLLLPLRQVNSPASAVSIPALSRLNEDSSRYRRSYFKMVNLIAMLLAPAVAFLIGTSDWVVRIVLGPQWDESARIFAILGFAALLMPIGNTTGWLYITQSRTRDMFHWGFIDAAGKIGSVIIGLQWGLIGLTVAVAMRYYIMAPFGIWFCCRRGPIRVRDFFPTYCYVFLLAASVLGTISAIRGFFDISNPVAGVIVCLPIVVVLALVIILVLPEGRSVLSVVVNGLLRGNKEYINAWFGRFYKTSSQ